MHALRFGLATLMLLCGAFRSVAETPPAAVATVPERLVNGGAFLVRVTPPPGAGWRSLEGTFEARKVFFERGADGVFTGFAGVDYDAPAGKREMKLTATPESGAPVAFTVPLAVERVERPKSELKVAKKFLEPDPRTRARIEREKAIKAELLGAVSPERLAPRAFVPPLTLATTEGYGVERVFNGKRQSVHYGLDYRAPAGTPVHAMNDGRVALARRFFYEGNCVAVDHGHGLYSLYLHFSKLEVKEGARVVRGQRLGLSGATGRVTGPHLHVAFRWQGLYLDPATVLALP